MASVTYKAKLFAMLQAVVPQHLISRLVGQLAASEIPWVKSAFIGIFRHFFTLDLGEAELENASEYKSFNHFFTRALKPCARPLPQAERQIVSPADGVISEFGRIYAGRLIQAKNHDYRLDELLPVERQDWLPFVNGDFVTTYLAPSDYHRVHMPLAGRLTKTVYVPGQLYSVNQATASSIPRLFAKNERLIAFFESDRGPFCLILVGAMIVSGIETVFHGLYKTAPGVLQWDHSPGGDAGEESQSLDFDQGQEFGRFLLGSTTIVLTPPGIANYLELEKNQVVRCRATVGHLAL